jgi:hypothetical protein
VEKHTWQTVAFQSPISITIRNAPVIRTIYEWAYKGWFDVYQLLKSAILWVYKIISLRHDGICKPIYNWLWQV